MDVCPLGGSIAIIETIDRYTVRAAYMSQRDLKPNTRAMRFQYESKE